VKTYIDLKDNGIEFKNLLSGPAQVGRIINYIIFTGNGVLRHKPGNRSTALENNIGYAWTVEFMIGLQLIRLGAKLSNQEVYRLELTKKGKLIFDLLVEKNIKPELYEGNSIDQLKEQLTTLGLSQLYNAMETIFRDSVVFKDLCIFLDINNTNEKFIVYPKGEFNDDFFAEMLLYYEKQKLNLDSRTSTGANRVPSLVQFCQFLNYCSIEKQNIVFDVNKLKTGNINSDSIVVSYNELIKICKDDDELNKKIEKLAEEYGVDGTTLVTHLTRVGQVQKAFKDRLINEYGKKCMVCGVEHKELLIASHIKPAYISDIYEKANNNNGLLLCVNHDKLFDRFLISFNFIDGKIMISDHLTNHDKRMCMLDPNFSLSPELLTPERCEFLMWHNNEFYQKNSK